jgi:hypothetical protein
MKDMSKHSLLFLLFVAGMLCQAVSAAAQENYYNPSQQEENRPNADNPPDARKPPEEIKTPAAEQEPAAVNSFTVTSIQKCYAQLSHEDALEIQQNYIKPYEECQRRLVLKQKKEQVIKTGNTKDTPVKKPSSFYSWFQRKDKSEKDTDKEESKKGPFFQEQVPLN